MVLLDYNKKKDIITFRHYRIELHNANINKQVRKIISTSKIPDLSNFDDISEFIKKKAIPTSNEGAESDDENITENKFED